MKTTYVNSARNRVVLGCTRLPEYCVGGPVSASTHFTHIPHLGYFVFHDEPFDPHLFAARMNGVTRETAKNGTLAIAYGLRPSWAREVGAWNLTCRIIQVMMGR